MTSTTDTITIRPAAAGDAAALRRLAALDSAEVLAGPALLAEVGGTAAAAIALDDGAVVADPFRLTADLVELLRLRRARLAGGERPARRGRGASHEHLPTTRGPAHAPAHLW